MNIVFLDIDGVLNNTFSMIRASSGTTEECWDEKCVEQFFRIVDSVSEVGVVLSSSWRYLHTLTEIEEMFVRITGRKPPFVGITAMDGLENINNLTRGAEIYSFLDNWKLSGKELTNYVILDDDDDMLPDQASHFIQTKFELGLTRQNADEAIEVLTESTFKESLQH
jgi:hypothetical protein